jgi:hypothetical protein
MAENHLRIEMRNIAHPVKLEAVLFEAGEDTVGKPDIWPVRVVFAAAFKVFLDVWHGGANLALAVESRLNDFLSSRSRVS